MKTQATRPVIPEATARMAEERLRGLASGEYDAIPDNLANRWQRAAESILKLFQTQERFSPEKVDTLMTRNHPSQNVRDLAALTDESLADLNARLAADYPGKPS